MIAARALSDAELLDGLPAAALRMRLDRILSRLGALPASEQDAIVAMIADAELLCLAADLEQTVATTERAEAFGDDALFDASYERECRLREAIAGIPPQTEAGARAVARAIGSIHRGTDMMPRETTFDVLVLNLVEYLTGETP